MRIKSLLWLLFLGLAGYIGYRVVPAYLANYQFQDAMRNVATVNSSLGMFRGPEIPGSTRSEEAIRQQLYQQAQSLGVPVTQEQINVIRNGSDVSIWADYTVHIELPYYPIDLNFHPSSKRM